MRGKLTKGQVDVLLRPINPRRVLQAQGQSHVPAYDVVAHLTRMFGFEGWDKEILDLRCVHEHAGHHAKADKKGYYVTYLCRMRLTIFDQHGNVAKVVEDVATGSASNMPEIGDAHDFAAKNAVSYAIKRCAKDLGDQFGLSLYNKGQTGALIQKLAVRGDDDVESHVPAPLSMGNDERQFDAETGEVSTPAAPRRRAAPQKPVELADPDVLAALTKRVNATPAEWRAELQKRWDAKGLPSIRAVERFTTEHAVAGAEVLAAIEAERGA